MFKILLVYKKQMLIENYICKGIKSAEKLKP